jgi:hypothetical protein
MAHITAEVRETPCGGAVARMDPVGSDVGAFLPDFDDLTFPLLRLVDPYGDTYFSAYQIAGLISELERLSEDNLHPVLGQLIRLAEKCRGQPGEYLVFIGD